MYVIHFNSKKRITKNFNSTNELKRVTLYSSYTIRGIEICTIPEGELVGLLFFLSCRNIFSKALPCF